MTRARTRRPCARYVLLACMLVGACDEAAIVAPRFVTRVRLDSGDCAGLHVGETCTLVATAFADDGEPVDDPRLEWRSANIVIATVTAFGVVRGHVPGNALIIVGTPNRMVADSATVRVIESEPDPEPPL
jgi:hypothetical protein